MSSTRFDMIDISRQVNRELSPNPSGSFNSMGIDYGWLQTGLLLATLPDGKTVRFNVIDPSENHGLSAAVTRGGRYRQQMSATFPHSFKFFIPENLSTNVLRIYILGIAAFWANKPAESEGTRGANIIIQFTDGSRLVQPLINGIHYTDWTKDAGQTVKDNGDGTKIISILSGIGTGKKVRTRADILSIDLFGYSHKKIRSISIEELGSASCIPILAITLERSAYADILGEGERNLSDITTFYKLRDKERLEKTIEAMIEDIRSIYTSNPTAAIGRAVLMSSLLINAAKETYPGDIIYEIAAVEVVKALLAVKDVRSLVKELFNHLTPVVDTIEFGEGAHTVKLIDKASEFVRKHYAEPIKDFEVAQHVSLSVSHFRHMFKQVTGISFHNYLIQVRMECAKRLLDETELTVLELSLAVGYRDPSYFSRVFKKYEGVSPIEYRQKQIQKHDD